LAKEIKTIKKLNKSQDKVAAQNYFPRLISYGVIFLKNFTSQS